MDSEDRIRQLTEEALAILWELRTLAAQKRDIWRDLEAEAEQLRARMLPDPSDD